MGFARPPFTRSAAFFFACASTKRSSSATQASSAAFAVFAGRFAGLSCALESAERFAGIVAEGAARWGKLLRSFRHGGGFRDAIIWESWCCWSNKWLVAKSLAGAARSSDVPEDLHEPGPLLLGVCLSPTHASHAISHL
jgi:hypothetical protein